MSDQPPGSSPAPAVMDYEGSDYQERFWGEDKRAYEDLVERIALQKLLPPTGRRLVEIGAGFGRLADLYAGYEQVILLDYSRSLLREAQARLGDDPRFLFVAANIYQLPLAEAAVDAATTVRVMHHLADVPEALVQIRRAIAPGGILVAEYASKRHLKSLVRYALRRQDWSPFDPEPYEFVPLNYDFHPSWMAAQLQNAGFAVERELAVSHFRQPLLKRLVPARVLAAADSAVQGVGALWKLTPSVFVRCAVPGALPVDLSPDPLICPRCRGRLAREATSLACPACELRWPVTDGLIDLKEPVPTASGGR